MKFEQKSKEYQPITITLESREEATAFFEAIDKVTKLDAKRNNALMSVEAGEFSISGLPHFTQNEIKALHAISHALTVQLVEI